MGLGIGRPSNGSGSKVYCERCGAGLKAGGAFCERCGAPGLKVAPTAPIAAPPAGPVPLGAPPQVAPPIPPPVFQRPPGASAGRKKQILAIAVALTVIGAGAGVLLLSGALGGTGQCVFQQTDFSGRTTTSRYDGYTEGECDKYCADHPGHPCWWDEY